MLAEKGKKSILPIASRVITFAFFSSWKFEFLLFVSSSHHTNLIVFLALHYVYPHHTRTAYTHSQRGPCMFMARYGDY